MDFYHTVEIDGKTKFLKYECRSNGDYQYNTSDNSEAHTFAEKLRVGVTIITNGHTYKVKD